METQTTNDTNLSNKGSKGENKGRTEGNNINLEVSRIKISSKKIKDLSNHPPLEVASQ